MISSSACFKRGMIRSYYLRFEQILDLMLVPSLMTSNLDRKCLKSLCPDIFWNNIVLGVIMLQKYLLEKFEQWFSFLFLIHCTIYDSDDADVSVVITYGQNLQYYSESYHFEGLSWKSSFLREPLTFKLESTTASVKSKTKEATGLQVLQALAFCVENVGDEHMKHRLKKSLGIKFKDGICAELCLKLWCESDW